MAKACILNDLTLSIVGSISTHNFVPMPPVPPVPPPVLAVWYSPAPASAFELPLPMIWPPGNLIGKNKYSTTVTHKMLGIIQAGHDLGIMIVHIQILPAPNNALTLIHIPFSSRKVMFSASTVKVHGQPAAVAGLIGLPPSPMMICADPMGFPIGEVPTRWLNTLEVGFTLLDFFLGVLAIAASMILDWIFRSKPGDLDKILTEGLRQAVIDKLRDAGGFREWATKQGVGILLGVVQIATTGQGSVAVGFGGPCNVQFQVQRDSAGNWQTTLGVQGPGVSGSVGYDSTPNSSGQAAGFNAQGGYNYGAGGGSGTASQHGDDQVTTHQTWGGETTSSSRPRR
jgi:hypothetical protein